MQHTIPCLKDCLYEMPSFVATQLSQTQLSETEKAQIVLAIDEACSNAIIHGNNCDKNRLLQLTIDFYQEEIRIEISDIGKQLPTTPKNTDFDIQQNITNKMKGGLGLRLIHNIMDNVDYYHRGNIGVCSLTKRLK